MSNLFKKPLILCCIAGIIIGFLLRSILKNPPLDPLLIGMVSGLVVGFLFDKKINPNSANTDLTGYEKKPTVKKSFEKDKKRK